MGEYLHPCDCTLSRAAPSAAPQDPGSRRLPVTDTADEQASKRTLLWSIEPQECIAVSVDGSGE